MAVRAELRYFTVTPQIVRASQNTEITIRALDNRRSFNEGEVWKVRHHPVDRMQTPSAQQVTAHNDELVFTLMFEDEQEHYIYVDSPDNSRHYRFSVYSLFDDLYGRRPLKGDLHMHSNNSDGQDHAAVVAAASRRNGYDYIALTDHRQYAPSLAMIDYYKDIPLDMLLLPGEEVHPYNNPVHMINFGGDISINDFINEHRDEYDAMVADILAKEAFLDDNGNKLPEALSTHIASCRVCFDLIRRNNGLGIYCHPYWYVGEGNYNLTAVNEYMFKHKCYDAEELLGGFYKSEAFSNYFEIARFFEGYWQGNKCGIVSVSDSHGTENDTLFAWYYTICFAEEVSRDGIVHAIRDRYSVAVEALADETPRVFGELRYVKYAYFLMQNVFLAHDEICRIQGDLMMRYFTLRQSGIDPTDEVLDSTIIALGCQLGMVDNYWDRIMGNVDAAE